MLNTKQFASVKIVIKNVQWAALHENQFNESELFAQSSRASFCESLLEDELNMTQRTELFKRTYNTTTEEPVDGNEVGMLIAAHHLAQCLHNAGMKRQKATA